MWPIRITGTPLSLAKRSSAAATSLIWLTEPGADSTVSVYIVCTESTIIRSGRIASASSMTAPISVSQKTRQLESSPPRRFARIPTCRALSSPVT